MDHLCGAEPQPDLADFRQPAEKTPEQPEAAAGLNSSKQVGNKTRESVDTVKHKLDKESSFESMAAAVRCFRQTYMFCTGGKISPVIK